MWQIALGFLCGDCLIQFLPTLPSGLCIGAVVVILLAAAAPSSRIRYLLIALASGVLWSWLLAAHVQADSLDPALEGHDVTIEGWIASLPDSSEADSQFLFECSSRPPGVPSKIKLAWYQPSLQLRPGEHWRFRAKLKRRNGLQNPGGFDYEALLFSQGIGATGYIKDDSRNTKLTGTRARYVVDEMRAHIAAAMAAALPNSPMLGVLQGLAVGDTREIPSEQWQVFAKTGITHLMAISGLHITMIAGLFAALGRSSARLPEAQAGGVTSIHGECVGGMLGALAYSLLAGMSIPTQRTLVMLCVYFVARWLRRELSLVDGLALALVTVLCIDPFAPLSAGAWLSFGAVAVLGICTGGYLAKANVVRTFGRVQWVVTIGLVPLIVLSFGSLSLVSPIANAAAIPLFTLLVVPLSLVGAVLSLLTPVLAHPILGVAAWLLDRCWPTLMWLANLPMAQWHFASPLWWQVVALIAGTLLLVVPGIAPMRYAGLLFCVPATFGSGRAVEPQCFELTVLDVGQGLAVVVRTHSHTLVYDTGPAFRSGRDAAQLAVLPYLYATGTRSLDMLVVSHDDLDHRGGMASLMNEIAVNDTRLGPSVRSGSQSRTCHRGDSWVWDAVRFEFLHPGNESLGSDNETSCVLLVSAGTQSVLLTGDIQDRAEHSIVENGLRHVTAVVAPHHGSSTSSTTEFVTALAPEMVIFSTGYLNRWGFPKPPVLDRWRAAGAKTFDTARSGAITLSVDPAKQMQVDEYRKSHRRYWRRAS